jgi:hypothetical protein
MFSGIIGWTPSPRHRLGLDFRVAHDNTAKATNWQLVTSYTLALDFAGRLDASAAGLSGSIRGFVFEDLNADGSHGLEEPGLSEIKVMLDDEHTVITDIRGNFHFRGVLAGRHIVSVERDEWHTVDGTRHTVDVQARETAAVSFGMNSGRRILVRVFDDRNGDKTFSGGELIVPASTVTLLDKAGEILGTHSALRGVTDFSALRPGEYTISVDPMGIPTGYTFEAVLKQSADLERNEYVVLDFPLHVLRTIGGMVFLDTCPDRRITGCDEPAANVTVTLSDGQQHVTDSNGRFLFRNLDKGNFEVRVEGAQQIPLVRLGDHPVQKLDLRILIINSPFI